MAVVLTFEGESLQRRREAPGIVAKCPAAWRLLQRESRFGSSPRRGARHDPAAFTTKVRWSLASIYLGTATTDDDDAPDASTAAYASSHIDA